MIHYSRYPSCVGDGVLPVSLGVLFWSDVGWWWFPFPRFLLHLVLPCFSCFRAKACVCFLCSLFVMLLCKFWCFGIFLFVGFRVFTVRYVPVFCSVAVYV